MSDKESLVQEIFRKTSTKITEDDPIIDVIIGFRQVMEEARQDLENNREDLKEWGAIFTSQFEDDIAELALKNNIRLEILEHEIKEVVEQICKELKVASDATLAGFDSKTKDLNMLLTKIQINHERDTNDNLTKHLAKIDERYNQMLAIQQKNNTVSRKEALFAIGGLVAGVVICLLASFII